jgi:arginase
VEARKMMENLCIIEAPSNLGLKEPAPGKEPGVKKLPEWLKAHNLYEKIIPNKIISVVSPLYSMHLDEDTGVRNADAIVNYSKLLSFEIQNAINTGYFPVVIGGDCSILIGCAHALKSKGKYGLFFIDGHTDFVMPHTSLTQGAAGMDLAIVTGYGHNKLTDIDGYKPYFEEKNVLSFGNRFLEEEYVNFIQCSRLAYFDLEAVRKVGIDKIVAQFLKTMFDNNTSGCWIHLDVDVIDDELMPCVDSRQPGGLNYNELILTLRLLLTSGHVAGIDITILDPDLDVEDRFTTLFVNEIATVLSNS